jgi:hypothetical protein
MYRTIAKKLAAGETIILDGGTGPDHIEQLMREMTK